MPPGRAPTRQSSVSSVSSVASSRRRVVASSSSSSSHLVPNAPLASRVAVATTAHAHATPRHDPRGRRARLRTRVAPSRARRRASSLDVARGIV